MAAENGESYTPRHAKGPIEPIEEEPLVEEPRPSARPAAVDETRILDGGDARPATSPASLDADAQQGADFDTDQMRSLSFLYGEGQPDTHAAQRPTGQRPRRQSGPRHVGRTQHPADYTASKYLGEGALKSSRQRKSSDYKNPGSQQRKQGARHNAQGQRGASKYAEHLEAERGQDDRTQVVDAEVEGRTRVLDEGAPAKRQKRQKAQSTRVLPSERARAAAASDETQVIPVTGSHVAPADATRVAPSGKRAAGTPVAAPSQAHKKKRKGPKAVVIVVVIVVAAIAVCAALLFRSVQHVQSDALELNKAISTIADDFRAGELEKVEQTVADITAISDRMHDETDSPLWKAASVLPVVGEDAGNAIVLCETIDELSDEVLVPLVEELPEFDSMSKDEQAEFAKKLEGYKDKVAAAKEVVEALDKGHIDQVNSAIEKAEDLLGKAEILLGG